ncbi:MAG: AmmeMemoRadiSam system protein B [Candidatus Komeilibacteria bacterium]|nr:AmmeMemoRadiSam system protein B [Candidatus Komeilibacteria bacterium]
MLVYAAHLPHSPALLRNINKSKLALFKKTKNAVAEIAADLYARQINTIVFITPHATGEEKAFVAHFAPAYKVDLSAVGDFSIGQTLSGDSVLAHRIVDRLCLNWPIKTSASVQLDTAASAVMLQINHPEKSFAILPLTYALLPSRELYGFGRDLREILENCQTRVAIISLGDLSRAKGKNTENAEEWDEELIHNLNAKNTDSILDVDFSKVDSFSMCGWRPLVMLLGVLSEVNYKVDILSYQQRFGVGMGVMRFIF